MSNHETETKPTDGRSDSNGGLAAGREECPYCGRLKARNADDAKAGDCDRWYAVRDKESRMECEEIATQRNRHSVSGYRTSS